MEGSERGASCTSADRADRFWPGLQCSYGVVATWLRRTSHWSPAPPVGPCWLDGESRRGTLCESQCRSTGYHYHYTYSAWL